MNPDQAIDFVRQALLLVLLIAGPVLLIGLIVALVVGLLQAATNVTEQSLTFVPKVLAMAIAGALLLPWMVSRLMDFAAQMFTWP
ncbi:MAG: flagellar type III secretion system protein FliQ [Actinobacteria bacterium]|nr:flagellar type III secretion system protein FliQ [Actinomycetota bacterium]